MRKIRCITFVLALGTLFVASKQTQAACDLYVDIYSPEESTIKIDPDHWTNSSPVIFEAIAKAIKRCRAAGYTDCEIAKKEKNWLIEWKVERK